MKSSQVLKRIFKYTGKYSAMLILGLIFSAGGVAMTLYSPILIGEAVDMIIGPDNVNFGGIGKIAIQLAVAQEPFSSGFPLSAQTMWHLKPPVQ